MAKSYSLSYIGSIGGGASYLYSNSSGSGEEFTFSDCDVACRPPGNKLYIKIELLLNDCCSGSTPLSTACQLNIYVRDFSASNIYSWGYQKKCNDSGWTRIGQPASCDSGDGCGLIKPCDVVSGFPF